MLKEDSVSPKRERQRRWIEVVGLATDVVCLPNGDFGGIRDLLFFHAIYRLKPNPDNGIDLVERWIYDDYESAKTAIEEWAKSKQHAPQNWRAHPPLTEDINNMKRVKLKSISK